MTDPRRDVQADLASGAATDGSVCLAYVHANEVAHSWHLSVLDLVGHDAAHGQRLTRGGYIAMRCGTGGLVLARNEVAKTFLQRPSEWLFLLDTDMGFRPDTLDRLLAAADKAERPIVGALCFAQKETAADGLSGFRCQPRPTIIDWVRTPDGRQQFAGRSCWQPGSVTRCAATGMACVLIHRSVLERIHDAHGETWYDRIRLPDGQLLGEDVSFCVRAGTLGFPVHVHTGVQTSHLKQLWLAESDYWAFWQPPPPSEEVAVIVPVLRRPHAAEPFMRSLRASTGLATVYAVHDRDDAATAAAWKQAGAILLDLDNHLSVATGAPLGDRSRPGSFAEKANFGYRYSAEPWLLLVGDDVRFHPGWLDHALAVAGDRYHVIGTNDLGNPRVTSGDHATHLLIRRSYVDEHGASWDGPGIVCHEGYRHWFVDDELVAVAKQRGAWAMALGAIVEHLHPLWGKADHDPTYELGQSFQAADREVFQTRCRTFR